MKSMRRYLAVTISHRQEKWRLPDIPFYCHIDELRGYPRSEQKLKRDRIDFLCKLRNDAMDRALTLYPDTTHIVNLESYYLPQVTSIKRLVKRYEELNADIILGGIAWARMGYTLLPFHQTYDTWCFPEFDGYTWRFIPPRGLMQVSSVGSTFIFPAQAWIEHRFGNPEPFPDAGIYYNWLCEKSRLPVFVDLSIRFYRDWTNSGIKLFRLRDRLRREARMLLRRV